MLPLKVPRFFKLERALIEKSPSATSFHTFFCMLEVSCAPGKRREEEKEAPATLLRFFSTSEKANSGGRGSNFPPCPPPKTDFRFVLPSPEGGKESDLDGFSDRSSFFNLFSKVHLKRNNAVWEYEEG